MAPKTIKMALSNMLADLKKDDLAKFCSQLVDRREEPRVRRNRVEGKSFLEIADVLVSAFTEQGALDVATEILNDIDCQNDAKNLAEDTRELTSKSGSTGTASSSAGAASGNTKADDKHFVDKHKVELIQRVSNTDSILDGLFDHDVIPQEVYDKIRAVPTTQARVRELYCGPLKAGQECKNVFYKLLEQHEKFLVEDLKKKA
ncbi:apoptosis-associated speck-like protein containing a CARD isoform X1 [Scomber scombrus]|uniref:apoptosis-associated speck-like protein containing a CARD isoform X1 n=1 Tax=Scomber scombrus TaxID=13677 RepID=UPI002DD96FF3|nr:apoptosis-associated speck-like protein containing a CARD isoform X1 [Scomber scombrus]